jgi:acyl-CoA reductase-like NAD-dependent aldehyde dehydrogenase
MNEKNNFAWCSHMSDAEERSSMSLGVDAAADHFIDGEPRDSKSDAVLEVFNPSNGRVCGTVPIGCPRDVDRAVHAARQAFSDGRWSDTPPSYKKNALYRFAELISAEAAALDALDAREMGKPIREELFNARAASGLMRFYAEAIDKVMGDVFASDKNSFVAQRRVPRGVVAAVTPWNFPTFNTVLKIAPALAAGNSVVLKPSELSPSSAVRLARLALHAGVPPGVLNVVLGLGETVGRSLGMHDDVDMMTFTGSTAVGKAMLQYSAQSNMKLVLAECGGKSPQIVLDDGVDLESASATIARLLLTNQGQICSVGSRLLVQRSIEKDLVEKIAGKLADVVMGDALDPRTTFGPMASASQCARVMRYIETAAEDGGRVIVGGRRTLRESGGYFIEPTLVYAPAGARIAQEEVFGPVLSIIPFVDEEEAVRIANGTIYALAAYVWTANLSRGMRMAKAISSSVVVNAAAPCGEGPGHAFSSEPARQSGIGIEGGLAGLESYMRRQMVWFNHA